MFEQAVRRILAKHGTLASYTKVTEGSYDVETGTASSTSTTYQLRMYMKHMRANQYNFPNLIGKEVGLFYLNAIDLPFVPKVQDYITFNGNRYKVDSVQSHSAEGKIILYRMIGIM